MGLRDTTRGDGRLSRHALSRRPPSCLGAALLAGCGGKVDGRSVAEDSDLRAEPPSGSSDLWTVSAVEGELRGLLVRPDMLACGELVVGRFRALRCPGACRF